jgi:excisionase family DNA binding protein
VIVVGEKLLSVQDVAEWLGVSERTVFNMINRGDIAGTKVGNRWRFEPEVVRGYLQQRQEEAQRGSQA